MTAKEAQLNVAEYNKTKQAEAEKIRKENTVVRDGPNKLIHDFSTKGVSSVVLKSSTLLRQAVLDDFRARGFDICVLKSEKTVGGVFLHLYRISW